MKKAIWPVLSIIMVCMALLMVQETIAQEKHHVLPLSNASTSQFKISSRSYGTIIGYQRGKYNLLELGLEHHWRKVTFWKPRIYSIGGNVEYNLWENVLGYKASFYAKRGRIALTYGINLLYYTDFTRSIFGGGPGLGFKLLGFNILTGYNFFPAQEKFIGYNDFFVGLRYYFPLSNKIKFKKSNPG